MKIFFLIVLWFCSSLKASSEFQYDSLEMRNSSEDLYSKHRELFLESGFKSLATRKGIPLVGINQVYFKSVDQFVLVKYGISGVFPLNTFISLPSGLLVHLSDGEEKFALFFRGFNASVVKSLVKKFTKVVTSQRPFSFHFISPAYGETCTVPNGVMTGSFLGELDEITSANSWDLLSNCLTGLGGGVWESTGGVAVGLSDEFKKFWNNPSEYFEKTSGKIREFLSHTKDFLSGLISAPKSTMEKWGTHMGEDWNRMSGAVQDMTLSMKIHFACQLIGSFGTDGFIAFYTGGAALSTILPRLALLSKKFLRIENLFSKLSPFLDFPEDKMGKLMKKIFKEDNDGDMRLFEGLSSEDFDPPFAKDLILCALD